MPGIPFRFLQRDSQQRRLRAIALEALSGYLIEPTRVRLVQYEDNAVYRVDTASARYMLRLSVHDGRSVSEQRSEVAWMSALLADAAVYVPRPVPVASGDPVGSLTSRQLDEPVTVAMFEWIPGRAEPDYTEDTLAGQLGTITARLHEHAGKYRPGPGFTRPSWGFAEVFSAGPALTDATAALRMEPGDRRILEDLCAAVAPRLPAPEGRDWGLIHSDLHRGNLVAAADGRVGVIDFDDCGWGYFMLDVATVLSSMFRVHGRDPAGYQRLCEQYLAAYTAVRPLPAAPLDEFLVTRDMIIVNFVLGSPNPSVATWGPHRGRGILRQFERYLDTGRYPGTIDLASLHLPG